MSNNDYVSMDTVDLKIFNEDGKLLTEINHNVKTLLSLGKAQLVLENALWNIELLKLLNEDNKDVEVSDFEKALNNKTTIKFSPHSNSKTFKIVANGMLISPDTNEVSHKFNLIVHSAKISKNHNLDFKMSEVHSPVFVFNLYEDSNREYVDLTLEEF